MKSSRDLTTGKETLYVAGGYKDATTNVKEECFKYDFDTDVWTPITKFRLPNRNALLVQFKGDILAIGGNEIEKSIEVSKTCVIFSYN